MLFEHALSGRQPRIPGIQSYVSQTSSGRLLDQQGNRSVQNIVNNTVGGRLEHAIGIERCCSPRRVSSKWENRLQSLKSPKTAI